MKEEILEKIFLKTDEDLINKMAEDNYPRKQFHEQHYAFIAGCNKLRFKLYQRASFAQLDTPSKP